jgi:anti-sigma regulatory factor (Ser/Thr protein kinase)
MVKSGLAVTVQTRRFDADPRSVQAARAFIRSLLVGCPPDLIAEMVLMTSELVTNAVIHAGSPVEVVVRIRRSSMRVEVWDQSPRFPELVPLSERSHHGRGLAIVDELSDQWGVTEASPGKTVWFILNQLAAVPPSDTCP